MSRIEGPGRRWMRMASPMLLYDRRIVANGLRTTFARWRDRGLLVTIVLILLAILRSKGGDAAAMHMAASAGVVAGFIAARAIDRRLVFHACETPFAADATDSGIRRRYAAAWHASALGGAILLVAFARLQAAPFAAAGYAVGAAAAHALGPIAFERPGIRSAFGPFIGWRRSVRVGIMVGLTAAGASAVLYAQLPRDAASILAAVVAGGAVNLMSPVDHAVVRFMAISGKGAWSSIAQQVRAAAACLAALVSLVALSRDGGAAGLALLAGTAVLGLLGVRTCLYRILPRRSAELVGGGALAMLVMIGTTVPFLILPAAAAMAADLVRRTRRATWAMT